MGAFMKKTIWAISNTWAEAGGNKNALPPLHLELLLISWRMLLTMRLSDRFSLLSQAVCAVCKDLNRKLGDLPAGNQLCPRVSALQSGQCTLQRVAGTVPGEFWRQMWLSSLLLMQRIPYSSEFPSLPFSSSCCFMFPWHACRGQKKKILGATCMYSCIADVSLNQIAKMGTKLQKKMQIVLCFRPSIQSQTWDLIEGINEEEKWNEALNRNSWNLNWGGTWN